MFVKGKTYLDCYATIPQSPANTGFSLKYMCNFNPHAPYSTNEHDIVNKLRALLVKLFKTQDANIIINSGGSEGNSTIINYLKTKGKNIICSSLDHPSVINKIREIKSEGYDTKIINVKNGVLEWNDIKKLLDFKTNCIILTHVFSELGNKNDIGRLAGLIKQYFPHCHVHVDYVQGFLKDKMPDFSNVDSASVSFHKVGALKGAGCLWVKDPYKLKPLISGSQNNSLRGGTIPVCNVASAYYALNEIQRLNMMPDYDLFSYLYNYLKKYFGDKVLIFTNPKKALGNCISFSLYNLCNKMIQLSLADKNIYIGTGSACSSKSLHNPLIESFNVPNGFHMPMRISWSKHTKRSHIEKFLNELMPLTHSMQSNKNNNLKKYLDI